MYVEQRGHLSLTYHYAKAPFWFCRTIGPIYSKLVMELQFPASQLDFIVFPHYRMHQTEKLELGSDFEGGVIEAALERFSLNLKARQREFKIVLHLIKWVHKNE
jgi:hypothetical protein